MLARTSNDPHGTGQGLMPIVHAPTQVQLALSAAACLVAKPTPGHAGWHYRYAAAPDQHRFYISKEHVLFRLIWRAAK